MVENFDHPSRPFLEAPEASSIIVVTPLQKYPLISEPIGPRFGVIVGEARSPESAESPAWGGVTRRPLVENCTAAE